MKILGSGSETLVCIKLSELEFRIHIFHKVQVMLLIGQSQLSASWHYKAMVSYLPYFELNRIKQNSILWNSYKENRFYSKNRSQ